MALHLNLFHEEILEQRQRQRDPLKIGVIVLIGIAVLLTGYYIWNAYKTLEIKGRLNVVEKEWTKVEPQVTAAQKRSEELNDIIKTTHVLDDYINNRFFWGPFLARVSRCVAPNIQLTALEGSVGEDNKVVTVLIDGAAAGREPRAAAEDLRQMLVDQLTQSYKDVKVEFKALEDLDTLANVGGTNMPMAHYVLTVSFSPNAPGAKPTPAPKAERIPKT